MDFPPAREFLSLDDQRAKLPIYDQETIDERPEPKMGPQGKGEGHMDLGGTEMETASIADFDLLKVIGKGSFGKVRGDVGVWKCGDVEVWDGDVRCGDVEMWGMN